ncbi:hypothetical protein [Candidatus Sororendozoicomonas aggregata]|uniref:pilus assembly PilX family protein n=1 Tax=Candidatus Sororendozoicomonas aggregata TaxID=3073239 RepID=UPI002ED645FA
MAAKRAAMTGYVLPVAMTVLSVLTFSIIGVMETSQTQERQARNEQDRMRVEQVAKAELDLQAKELETHVARLRQSRSYTIRPISYPNGCSSSGKNAICLTVNLTFMGDLSKPQALIDAVPNARFIGRKFRLESKAEHRVSGASSTMNMELSYGNLILLLRQDIPQAMGTKPDRDELMGHLKFYIPDWWEVTVKEVWRFGCMAPRWSWGALFTGMVLLLLGAASFGAGAVLTSAILMGAGASAGAASAVLGNENILFVARCRVSYTDKWGRNVRWESDTINPGDNRWFLVPEDSSSVNFYWRGVVPGRAAGYKGFWQWGVTKWWTFKQFDWYHSSPVDNCRIAYGTSESPRVEPVPCAVIVADDQTPVNPDPENSPYSFRHGHYY